MKPATVLMILLSVFLCFVDLWRSQMRGPIVKIQFFWSFYFLLEIFTVTRQAKQTRTKIENRKRRSKEEIKRKKKMKGNTIVPFVLSIHNDQLPLNLVSFVCFFFGQSFFFIILITVNSCCKAVTKQGLPALRQAWNIFSLYLESACWWQNTSS